jgi:hypothetical protein
MSQRHNACTIIRDASGEVSAKETGDKDLKIAKAFCFGGIFEFIFIDDVKTAVSACEDTALHLKPAGKEVVENTGLLLNWISNQDLMNRRIPLIGNNHPILRR